MKVLFVCGGTAGHINPALAIAGKLRELFPDTRCLFIGADRTLEKELIPAAGYRLENVSAMGFTRSLSPAGIRDNVRMLQCLRRAAGQTEKIIREFQPDLAVGTGGYVCYPVLKKAASMGIPTALHESNAIPGLTTRLLERHVDRIMVAFPGAAARYQNPRKVAVTGTPVRSDFLSQTREEARSAMGWDDMPLVVSMWGSLGASRMNEYMADFVAANAKSAAFRHIHATGGGDEGLQCFLDALSRRGVDSLPPFCIVRSYIRDMGTVMNAADLVLCRAGASTIAELTALGKPSVLVPSPNVTNHHQEKNAREVQDAGGAVMIPEETCSGEHLYETVLELVRDRERLLDMGRGAASLGNRDSVSVIAEMLRSMIH